MSNVEEFRKQLDEALTNRQKEVRVAEATEKARQKQLMEIRVSAQIEAEKEVEKAERQKNQKVLELDAQLPIRQYLEILKDRIAPRQKVIRWEPEGGIMAYSFIFDQKVERIHEFNRIKFKDLGLRRTLPSYPYGVEGEVILPRRRDYEKEEFPAFRSWLVNDVFYLTLNSVGEVNFSSGKTLVEKKGSSLRRILDNITIMKEPSDKFVLKAENPLLWKNLSTNWSGLVVSPDGLQQLEWALTGFYVELKTRKGK